MNETNISLLRKRILNIETRLGRKPKYLKVNAEEYDFLREELRDFCTKDTGIYGPRMDTAVIMGVEVRRVG